MTRATKGRVALLGLFLVIGGFALALATTRGARVRLWTWRMRSGDSETSRLARRKLIEIGRPDIDGVLPELVAREAEEWDVFLQVETAHHHVFVGQCEMKERGFNTVSYRVERE